MLTGKTLPLVRARMIPRHTIPAANAEPTKIKKIEAGSMDVGKRNCPSIFNIRGRYCSCRIISTPPPLKN